MLAAGGVGESVHRSGMGAVTLGLRGWSPVLAVGLGGFAAGAALRQLVLAMSRQGWRGVVGRANGGMIVHLGVVIVAVAMIVSCFIAFAMPRAATVQAKWAANN